MDAKVHIWVGVKSEDCDISEVANKLAGADSDYEFETIDCSEEKIGFGVVVFSHDWDYGVIEFDASSIQHKAEKAMAAVKNLFDEHGIDAGVGVWCQTDFG